MKIITFNAYQRPHYLRPVLDALRKCVGIQNWKMVASIDYGSGEGWKTVQKMLVEFDACPVVVNVAEERLGCDRNGMRAFELGIQSARQSDGTDIYGVLYTEEDIVLSPDALTLAEDYLSRKELHHDQSAGLWLMNEWPVISNPNSVSRRLRAGGLFSNGCVSTPDQYERFYKPCAFLEDDVCQAYGFDWKLGWHVQRLNLELWRPYLSRSNNIGLVGENSHGTLPPAYSREFASEPVDKFVWEEA